MKYEEPVLICKNISVKYIKGDHKGIGIKEYLIKKLSGSYEAHEFYANKNVSFTLDKGDILGIIGSNGAGKSTLLKAISGILTPTSGQIIRKGTMASLLELGSGFDGDLTVKENTFLRGAMLGYTRKFMNERYDDIIEFAELKDVENRRFRQLSSGMRARLAFSISSLLAPDILILDEVLSVGDGAFKIKSEKKMMEMMMGGCATVLVSHSIHQIRSVCNKVLWLHSGEVINSGKNVKTICDQYETFLKSSL